MRIELQSKKAKLKTAGKFVEEDIEIASKLQSKNVTPTESPQTVNTDSGFSGWQGCSDQKCFYQYQQNLERKGLRFPDRSCSSSNSCKFFIV